MINSEKEKADLNTSLDAELIDDDDELYICHKNSDPNKEIITPQSISYFNIYKKISLKFFNFSL